MKRVLLAVALIVAFISVGCDNDNGSNPEPTRPYIGPPEFYSFSGTVDPNEGFLNLIKINTPTGEAQTLWKIGVQNEVAEDGTIMFYVTPFGLAFNTDGTMYTIINWLDFTEGHQKSRLARVDMANGVVTYIGDFMQSHFAGPDIDVNGVLWATSFTVGDPAGGPPYIFGDNNLYRFDLATGTATRVGDTGRGNWMDLAFDSKGRLWATVDNKLFLLNTTTGAATFVMDIEGVPKKNIPGVAPEDWPYNEVMTIAFDENDVLWATAMRGFSMSSYTNGTVMRIDIHTGQATLVGYTGTPFNHGGDILFTH